MNIYEKILAVMQDVEYLQKDGNVAFKQTNYNYLSEEKITANVRNAMIAHRLIMFPVNCCQVLSEPEFDEIIMTYRIVDIDLPESFIEVKTKGCGYDKGDKKSYKAMTGAFKYAMRQTFMISTGDDPDKEASEKTAGKTKPVVPKSEFSKICKEYFTKYGEKCSIALYEFGKGEYKVAKDIPPAKQNDFLAELKKLDFEANIPF